MTQFSPTNHDCFSMVGKSSFDLLLSWISWLISLLDRYVERTASCEQSADSAASLTLFLWLNAGQDPPAFTKASLRSSTVAYVPPSAGGAVTVGVALGVDADDADDEPPQPAKTNAPATTAVTIPRFFNFQFLTRVSRSIARRRPTDFTGIQRARRRL